MPPDSMEKADWILHVDGGSPETARRIRGSLNRIDVPIETCSDVYSGLACLTHHPRKPAAILVCLEGLAARDLLFFREAGRLCPTTPVYVYGAKRYDGVFVRARELGAAGRLTESRLAGLMRREQPVEEPADRQTPQPPSVTRSPATGSPSREQQDDPYRQSARARTQTADDLPLTEQYEAMRFNGPEDVDAEVSSFVASKESPVASEDSGSVQVPSPSEAPTGVQVPWNRESGRPARRPPTHAEAARSGGRQDTCGTRRPPTHAHAAPVQRTTLRPAGSDNDTGPLLTEEELQALLGDDDELAIESPLKEIEKNQP